MDSSLIRRLVTTHLRPFERGDCCLQLFGAAGALAFEAAAISGFGLDLYSGERVLAAIGLVGSHGRFAAAFTNHRTIVGGPGIGFAIRHDEIVGVVRGPETLAVRTPAGTRDLAPLHAACGSLADFYGALAAADPSARVEPPCPVFTPSHGDPTGAQAAIRELWSNDPSAAEMLSEIARRTRSGDLDDGAAQDLVGRVVLAHRARSCGPAAFGASYLSPLPAADFGELLLALLGTPSSRRASSPGVDDHAPPGLVERLDFDVEGTAVSISSREVSGGTCYSLHAGNERLEARDGALAHRLHRRLVDGAHRWLAHQCSARPFANAG